MTKRVRTAILISGRGSNMMSLVAAARAADYPAEIVAVLSNRPEAPGLTWARDQGLASQAIDHKAYDTREAFEDVLHGALEDCGAELVACAGFMRIMTPHLLSRWTGRMLNIHPSLLPAYKGLHTHARALADGVRIAGCTVHFVVPEMDSGPIVAQAAVPVAEGDTPDALAARILAVEHRIYPHALALVASGRARLSHDRVVIAGEFNHGSALLSPWP